MSVYRPTYTDKKTGKTKASKVWWYHFTFAGRHIQESSKSTRKTIATDAEKKRRLDLEKDFNDIEDKRHERVRSIKDLAREFEEGYKLRNPKSSTFVEYALGHVMRILGAASTVDITDATVKDYQTSRLKEKASPKSINEEVGLLLRILGERGDFLRAKLKRKNALKLKTARGTARAYTPTEKAALLQAARKRRSPSIYPALMLALHVGMRDAEIRGLQWDRLDLHRALATVGEAKTEAGEGRTIPLNADVLEALVAHSKWYLEKFGEMRPEWYVFPAGKPQPTDPTRPTTSFKTVWAGVKKDAAVTGRWHDNRHTFITDLAESGEASDETIRDIAGHVSKQMLKHYSHIRMEAKRRAVNALARKPTAGEEPKPETGQNSIGTAKESAKVEALN
jgi:integrase